MAIAPPVAPRHVLRRHLRSCLTRMVESKPLSQDAVKGAYGIRTRAAAVRGRCPRPLDECAVEPDCSGVLELGLRSQEAGLTNDVGDDAILRQSVMRATQSGSDAVPPGGSK